MPTHLDHREALLPSGLPLAVVGHLLPKVFPALRNQRLDDLLPLLRPCASARRFRRLDTRGFARRRGAGTSAVRLLNPVGGVRLQLLQLHLRGLCVLPRRLAHRRQDLQRARRVSARHAGSEALTDAGGCRTSRSRRSCSNADRPSVLASTPESAGLPAIVGETMCAPGVKVDGLGVTGASASCRSRAISSVRSDTGSSTGTRATAPGGTPAAASWAAGSGSGSGDFVPTCASCKTGRELLSGPRGGQRG